MAGAEGVGGGVPEGAGGEEGAAEHGSQRCFCEGPGGCFSGSLVGWPWTEMDPSGNRRIEEKEEACQVPALQGLLIETM